MNDNKRNTKFSAHIPELFLADESEAVNAENHKEAEILLAKKFREKVISLSDEELVKYLGLEANPHWLNKDYKQQQEEGVYNDTQQC